MSNRLGSATSPYLLQHKDNPVDWWEWGAAPFAEAQRRDVPVLLSVGYAACHWCHVMAHESFEDETTAAEMNRLFVNVKVDREERPDVDSIYMESVQAMSGHGGWPMTVWLDHDGRPFYAGTYFPNRPRHGMPSFGQVMEAVSTAWTLRRDEVTKQAERLVATISREIPAGDVPDAEALAEAYRKIESSFDPVFGGFGGSPKFPQQPVLEFLLRVRDEAWAPNAVGMLVKTLDEIAAGGIHDQIGGGFARYSVDAEWLVPHFEKMLYDNAQLARLYLWAGIEFGRGDFLEVARSTLLYLERDLRHSEGGFFSSEDADSEGVEGKFYVWSPEEIRVALGEDAAEFIAYYGVTSAGNFEGMNILNVVGDDPPGDLDRMKTALLEVRRGRVRPGLDDKVLAAWNGLAIRAFAEAGAVLEDDHLLDLARSCAGFTMDNLVVDGTLMRSWRDGRTSVPGFLDDHAGLAVGLFTLFAATGEVRWYQEAMGLVGRLDDFTNPDGGFYSTSATGERLVKRPVDFTDNPLPSGNALAAEALMMASLYTGDQQLQATSTAALGAVGLLAERYPSMVGHHLAVAQAWLDPREVAILGDGWNELARVYWKSYRPGFVLAASSAASEVVPLLADRWDGSTRAFVCRGFSCDLPTSDPAVLAAQLA
jgi:uncharacterized protein YyaL (SSP411 family)